MEKDKKRLIGLKYLIAIARMHLFMLVIANLSLIGTVDAQTPQIWPSEISFNYEISSINNDAVTIRKNATTQISAPEYIHGSKNESCAYIMGQSNRKIRVKFASNNSNMNYLVKATVISGTGIGNVCEILVAPCNLNTTVFTIDLSGSVPGSVGKQTFTWKWEATALPLSSPYCPITCTPVNTTHTYYTLLAAPQAPMPEPWTEVLDKACVWASGQSTEFNVVSKITEGAYNNLGKKYWGGGSHAYLPYFDLTSFLSASWADCRDMSAVLQVFTNALGGSNIRVRSIDYYSGSFYYKPICAIGGNCNNPNDWKGGYWNFHQFGYLNNVFDACLKLKQSAPRIPINEPIQIGGSYETDLRQSGSWNIDNTSVYLYVY